MIEVNHWSTTWRELDFSSAGLFNVSVRSIHLKEELLCNAYELTDWEEENDRMQLIICEDCGTVHCKTGGWVTFRRAGKDVFVIPLFSQLLRDDDRVHAEYEPPACIHMHGALIFKADAYQKFTESFPEFPEYEIILPISYREALLLFQLEAPGRLLGDIYRSPSDPKRLEMVLAASEGDAKTLATQVAQIFDDGLRRQQVAVIATPESNEQAVKLFVDLPEYPEWNVFWKGKTLGLYLSPENRLELIIEPV